MCTQKVPEAARTAIILLNWNGDADTLACLESLRASDRQDFVAVVCDNGSSDESWQKILHWGEQNFGDRFCVWAPGLVWHQHQQLVLMQTGANLGFAGGCNVGIRFALQHTQCDYLWLLNNDTLVQPDSLSHLVRRMDEDQSLGLLGSTLLYDLPGHPVQCFGGYGFNFWTGRVRPFPFHADAATPPSVADVEKRIRYVSGASTFTTRTFVQSVGLLNEQYFLYFEEIDWAIRGSQFRLSYCPESVVIHKEGKTIGSSRSSSLRSEKSELWLTRNRVLFTRTYFPSRVPIVTAWIGAVALVRGVRHGHRAAINLVRGWWNGMRAPILPLPRMGEWTADGMQGAVPLATPDATASSAAGASCLPR